MGYRIVYDGEQALVTPIRKPKSRFSVFLGTSLVLFVLLTHWFWPAGRKMMQKLLIPGDPEVTMSALSNMVEQLRDGEPMGDAVTGFCREILRESEIPD